MQTSSVKNSFTRIAVVVMSTLFVTNGIVSRDCDPFRFAIWGGGCIADFLGASYKTVFEDFQVYRLLTYGYVQTTIWHLLANIFALWWVGSYLEQKIGTAFFFLMYHTSLVIAGASIFLFYPNSFNYGASPAVFSCFGLLAHWLVRKKALWHVYRNQKGFVYCAFFFILSNLFGVASLVIHFLGFSIGFLWGFFIREHKISLE